MAKVTGPLFSMTASGSLRETLTYKTWKGSPQVRKHAKPANPKTTRQINQRRVFKDLVHLWQSLPTESKAEWNGWRSKDFSSGFNRFMERGLSNYASLGGPAIPAYGVTVSDSPPNEEWTWLWNP